MKKIWSVVTFLAVSFLVFVPTALAAGAVSPEDGSLLDLAKPVLQAVMAGQWWVAAALALVLSTAAARRYLKDRVPFFASDFGAAVLVLVGSFGGALATAAAAWTAPSWALVLTAGKVAFFAAGGYSLMKPLLRWLSGVAPAWTRPVIDLILAGIGTSPVAKADKAGADAVAAKPGGGVAAIVGEPRDVP